MTEQFRHAATAHILSLFRYEHLPERLQVVSRPFSDLAHAMADSLGDGPELTVGLRKLVESKDAIVRHAVLKGEQS